MRSLITGTDFIRDIDGNFKAIETNTNVALSVDTSRYLDTVVFTEFITNNNIEEIVVICNDKNMQIIDHESEMEEKNEDYIDDAHGISFIRFLRDTLEGTNVIVTTIKVDDNTITIPSIEDAENKLIIRLSYDTTALIDDMYAKDNWEFLKLMYDSNPNSIPKTYIEDTILGFDSIGTYLRDNNNHPNYCIKKRITPANNNIYPKLLKIDTIEQLNIIKNDLGIDEYLQEFICDPNNLLENKLKVYRSIDLIYGSNLDVLHLWDSEATCILDLINTPDYNDNSEVQIWDRNRYVTKYNSIPQDIAIKLSADSDTRILKPNNEISTINELNVGDYVKSINFPSIPTNTSDFIVFSWTGDTSVITENYSIESSEIINKTEKNYFGEIIEFELDNGLIFSDVPHAIIFAKLTISGSTIVKFITYQDVGIGSILFLWDNETETIVERTVIRMGYSYQNVVAYSVDVSVFDLFLTLGESGDNRYGLITHNYNYDCRIFNCPTSTYITSNQTCALCNSGAWVVNECALIWACCRVNYTPPNPYGGGPEFEYCDEYYLIPASPPIQGCQDSIFFHSTGAWCNESKPPAPASET